MKGIERIRRLFCVVCRNMTNHVLDDRGCWVCTACGAEQEQ